MLSLVAQFCGSLYMIIIKHISFIHVVRYLEINVHMINDFILKIIMEMEICLNTLYNMTH